MRKLGLNLAFVAVACCVTVWLMGAAKSENIADKSLEELKKICEKTINDCCQGNEEGLLLANGKSCPSASDLDMKMESVRQVRRLKAYQEPYKKYLGCELVKKRFIGSVGQMQYLAKYDNGFAVWTFRLYRPHNEWKFQGFGWSFGAADLKMTGE